MAQRVLDVGSPAYRYFGQPRNMLLGPQILVLQVAHPVVGAGVLEHSDYQREPWRRLIRTARSLDTIAYGHVDSATREAARLRSMHRSIKGVDARGRRYHALDPEAYAWVHATLVRGAIQAQRLFGRGIPADELPAYYADMRRVGLLLGLRDRHLPPDLAAFDDYYTAMVRDRLEDNGAVRDVLATIRRPARPGTAVPGAVWAPISWYVGSRAYLVTVGTLPAVLRERLGLSWSPEQERQLRLFARNIRWEMAVLERPLVTAARLLA
jgi:uncharacterized protein (DUF2236 family)